MSAFLSFAVAFGAGVGLGLFYFGGLWLTVQRLPGATLPGLLMLCSFLGRLGVILLAFFFIMDGHWERLALCLLGFVLVRFVLVRRWRPEHAEPHPTRAL